MLQYSSYMLGTYQASTIFLVKYYYLFFHVMNRIGKLPKVAQNLFLVINLFIWQSNIMGCETIIQFIKVYASRSFY